MKERMMVASVNRCLLTEATTLLMSVALLTTDLVVKIQPMEEVQAGTKTLAMARMVTI